MSDLLEVLQERARNIDNIELLAQMGYYKPDKALDRLNQLLTASDLLWWFNHSGFDFKYSNQEFIFELGKTLRIPQKELLIEVAAVREKQLRIEKMFQPYLFIDTNFKRQNQPIFALALLEGQRHITLSKYDVLNDRDAELERVKRIVQGHYKDTGGQLNFWGKIQRYIYVFGADQKVAILPDGGVISTDKCRLQRAILTIGGKELSPLFAPNISEQFSS
jgi:hypothetical protein